MTQTEIYIGLNDEKTKEQKFDTALYVSILKTVCANYQVPFSFHLLQGGYIHDNGEYTQENTLKLTLLGVDPAVVEEIATDLCVFFHQESVLITTGEVETFSIKANVELPKDD